MALDNESTKTQRQCWSMIWGTLLTLCYLGAADLLLLLLVAVLKLRWSALHIVVRGGDTSLHIGKCSRLGGSPSFPLQSLSGCKEQTENLYQASQSTSRKGKTRDWSWKVLA